MSYKLTAIGVAQAVEAATETLRARFPVLILGKPGIGKSALAYPVAKALGLTPDQVYPFDAPTKMAPDIGGGYAPNAAERKMVLCAPDDLPDGPGILLAEDLPAAPKDVFAGFLALWGRRAVGAWGAHENLYMMGNGNNPEDAAGANRITTALGNRCAVLYVEPDHMDWCAWAEAEGVYTPVVQYIKRNPKALFSFKPDQIVNATPRSWHRLANVMEANAGRVSLATATGWVGEAATPFMAWYQQVLFMPTPDEVKVNPLGVAVPNDPAGLRILLSSIAASFGPGDAKALIAFIMRPEIHADLRATGIRDIVDECERMRKKSGGRAQLVDSSAWTQFRIDHSALFTE